MSDEKREPLASPAQSETPGMLENSMRENRETPQASGSSTPDRLEKATSYKTSMYASGESDSAVVPAKCPNKGELCRRRARRKGCWPRRTNDPDCTPRTLRRVKRVTGSGGGAPGGGHAPDAIIQGRSRMH
jgi:hypothetical protein